MKKLLKKSSIILMIFLILMISLGSISASNDSNNETIVLEEIDNNLENSNSDTILTESEKSFSDLNTDITDKTEVNLDSNYTYSETSDADYKNGININKELTINGNGKTLNPNGNLLFNIGENGKLILNDLTITNSYSLTDAMIKNTGTLTLNNVTFTANRIFDKATANLQYNTIENTGELLIKNSFFIDSTIETKFTSSYSTPKSLYYNGLIYNLGNTVIENTVFKNNNFNSIETNQFNNAPRVTSIIKNSGKSKLTNVTISNNYVHYTHKSFTYFQFIDNENNLIIEQCLFENNTFDLSYNGESYVRGLISNKGELNLSNSIINNNSYKAYVIYFDTDATGLLNNNYWGSNNPDFNIINKNKPENSIILEFTPDDANKGIEKILYITLNKVNESGEIKNLETGSLPDYNIPINSKQLGTSIIKIKNGIGEYKYTALEIGEDIITLDGKEYTINIKEIKKPNFEITVKNTTYNKPLEINFTITEGSQDYEKYIWTVTDKTGNEIETGNLNTEGKITTTSTYSPGNYTIKVKFVGDEEWSENEISFDFEVKKDETIQNPINNENQNNTTPNESKNNNSATNGNQKNGQKQPTTVVKKTTPKITAKKKTFKSKTKIKKYTILLKTGKKAISKAKITLKISKKTYKATTNKKGQATFKIKKLTKKGKYKATIKYNGNNQYNKATKTIKITIK